MIEAFARQLVNKIILEAFNNLENNTEHGKYTEVSCYEEMNDYLVEVITNIQRNENTYNEAQVAETINQMLRGLGDIQIGDWSHVKPVLSVLERQVKNAVRNIENTSIGDTISINEQGDANQNISAPLLDASVKETTIVPAKNQSALSLLNRMIEELQAEQDESRPRCFNMEIKLNSTIKADIAAWEEREERCVRVIEGPSDQDDTPEIPVVIESEQEVCYLDNEATTSFSSSNIKPLTKSRSFEEIIIDESSILKPICLPTASQSLTLDISSIDIKQSSSSITQSSNKQPKKSIGKRIRNFFLSVFKRKKN